MSVRQRSRRDAWMMAGITMVALSIVVLLWTRNTDIDADSTAAPIFKIAAPVTDELVRAPKPSEVTPPAPEPPTALESAESATMESEAARHEPSAVAAVLEPLTPLVQSQVPLPTPAPLAAAAAMDQAPVTPVKIEPPTLLGELAVRPGDTFLGLVRLVYGTSDHPYLRTVIEANPQIVNPNAIDLDDVISFPALAVPAVKRPGDEVRVVLDRQPTLAAARSHLERMRQSHHLAVRLAAHWSPGDGLGFTVVSARYFSNARESQWWIDRLPEELKSKADHQTGWPQDAILYSMLPTRTD